MFATRWQPFSPVWNQWSQLQDEGNRLFGRWTDDTPNGTPFPARNLWEEDDSLRVEAELPGLSLEDLEIFVTGTDQLTIKGERKANPPSQGAQHRQEREFGSFVRVLTLPVPVDATQVEARLENGVLRLKLPKHALAKPLKIAVKAS